MAQSVDPSRVIEKLAMRIARQVVETAMSEVALEEAQDTIEMLKMASTPDAT